MTEPQHVGLDEAFPDEDSRNEAIQLVVTHANLRHHDLNLHRLPTPPRAYRRATKAKYPAWDYAVDIGIVTKSELLTMRLLDALIIKAAEAVRQRVFALTAAGAF